MFEERYRQAAALLLQSAIRMAPPDARIWGLAMQGELNQVRGGWAALTWALGGAGVLVRRALASLLIPGRRGQEQLIDGGLFAKRISVRRVTLAAGGGCVLGALLFFAAPPFRQALHVSFTPWYLALRGESSNFQPSLEVLARRARRNHDAEGLAFCAVRMKDGTASSQLATEAVGLDPNLLWVYAVMAARHPHLPEIKAWLSELARSDPQNSLVPLLAAELSDTKPAEPGAARTEQTRNSTAWQSAMAAAFQSERFDDYLNRLEELDRKVVAQYAFYEPEEVLAESDVLPASALEDTRHFAASRIRSGQDLKARGNWNGAREQYWSVAHLGQIIDAQARTELERRTGAGLQTLAYQQLRRVYKREGAQAEAGLFSYLAGRFEAASTEHFGADSTFGQETCRRNAMVLMASGLLALVLSGLLAIAASILTVGSLRSGPATTGRTRSAATIVTLSSAVGLLLCSATIYLTYRPYWYIFQHAILNGDTRHTGDLRDFLTATRTIPGVASGSALSLGLSVCFWTGLILIAFIGLILSLLRYFRERTAADGLHPRVP